MNKRLVLKIYGDVQGVNFRWHTRLEAEKLGLAGWVRNEPDGSVAVVAEGSAEVLHNFLDFCYNYKRGTNDSEATELFGPSDVISRFSYNGVKYANVQKIDASWEKARGELLNFEIRG